MQNDYLIAKEVNEKQRAVEKIVEYTLSGLLCWNKNGNKYVASFQNNLSNRIEFENYTISGPDRLNLTKLIINNEHGSIEIYNGDITSDLHRRLINCICNQVNDRNVLVDFL